jgi:hypothetical protein
MANTFVKIASVTVGSGGAASIDFTGIPASYTDLCLVHSLRSSNTDDYCGVEFNSSSSSFSSRSLQGNGSTASSATRSDNLFVGTVVQSTLTADTFSNGQIYIPNYAGSAYKSFSYDAVQENNATSALSELFAGLWSNTAAVTSVKLVKASGNFVQYSTATLYGIKKD